MHVDRRQWLVGGLCSAAVGFAPSARAAFAHPLGFQIYAVRDALLKDFTGTLRRIAAYGYRRVELISFPGYADDDDRNGFGPLATMAPAAIRRAIRDAGLTVDAAHFKVEEFAPERIGASMEWAHGVGFRRLTVSEKTANRNMTEWRRNIDRLTRAGDTLRKAGFQLGYHTSQRDTWVLMDGAVAFDVLMKETDPALLGVQLDLSTTLSQRVDPVTVLERHGPRIFSMHLRDGRTPPTRGDYVNALPLGTGEIDWHRVLGAAQKAGVRDYVVEMVTKGESDPETGLRVSAEYLRNYR